MADISPFTIAVSDEAIADLKTRLKMTRWPEKETPNDWSQGVPLAVMKELCDYWLHHYDWRQREALLNRFPQFKTDIDGLSIHFLHVRSPHAGARPLLMTHGWPGSIVEFQKVIEPLTRPGAAFADKAFHLVCPSLPGYGFSDKPAETGWGVTKIAGVWNDLMLRLGSTGAVILPHSSSRSCSLRKCARRLRIWDSDCHRCQQMAQRRPTTVMAVALESVSDTALLRLRRTTGCRWYRPVKTGSDPRISSPADSATPYCRRRPPVPVR